jgi:4-nitrophenyl phosphatase
MLNEGGYAVTGDVVPQVVAVAVGVDFTLTYDKLKHASLCLRAGADFIATNNDATFPTPEGLVPGAGSIVAALQTASGKTPVNMGKPNAPMFEAALRALDTQAGKTLMVGDRLDTDILGAAAVGMQTALVLTGVSTADDVAESVRKPDGVYAGLPALLEAWNC